MIALLPLVALVGCFGIDEATYHSRLDQDGDGAIDEPLANADELIDCDDNDPDNNTVPVWYLDADGDGEGAGEPIANCEQRIGTVANALDCDDTDPSVNTRALVEWCDSLDNDCDGLVDELDPDLEASARWYPDDDGDGYGLDGAFGTPDCGDCPGLSNVTGDCDDADDTVHPFATEQCDGLDNDCDGKVVREEDADGDLYRACDECDDDDPLINPSRTERCNGVDDNCDGAIDEPTAVDATEWFVDTDGDGYGVIEGSAFHCSAPAGFTDVSGDCAPDDAGTHPGSPEVWYDGVDDNCDGNDTDQDGDGASSDAHGGTDCDDTDAGIAPHVPEDWYNGIDENCDGRDDDQDGDGKLLVEDCNDTNADLWRFDARVPSQMPTIAGAVDEMCAGGTVFLDAGDHYEIYTVTKDLAVVGAGEEATTLFGRLAANNNTLSVSDLTIDGNGVSEPSCIQASNGAHVVVREVTLANGSASDGGGLHALDSSFDIDGLRLIDNTAGSGGGMSAIRSTGTARNLYGTGNNSNKGSVLEVANSPDGGLLFEDLHFEDNFEGKTGGDIYIGTADAELRRVTLLRSIGRIQGGAMSLDGFTGVLEDFFIEDSFVAGGTGAGIHVKGSEGCTIRDGVIRSTWANVYAAGFGIMIDQVPDMVIEDVVFEANHANAPNTAGAGEFAGVLTLYKSDRALLDGLVVTGNTWNDNIPAQRHIGIGLYDSDNVTVRDVLVADHALGTGLRSETRYLAPHNDLLVEYGVFAQNRQGVEIIDCVDCTARHLTVVDNEAGVVLGGATLTDSLVTHTSGAQVAVTGGDGERVGFFSNAGGDYGGACTACSAADPEYTAFDLSDPWMDWDLTLPSSSPFSTSAEDGSQLGAYGGGSGL